MIYMFLSNNPSSGEINLSTLPCLLEFLHKDVCVLRNNAYKSVVCRGRLLHLIVNTRLISA